MEKDYYKNCLTDQQVFRLCQRYRSTKRTKAEKDVAFNTLLNDRRVAAIVGGLMKRYQIPGLTPDDIKQYILLALGTAMEENDPGRGKFHGFFRRIAVNHIATRSQEERRERKGYGVKHVSHSSDYCGDGEELSATIVDQKAVDPVDVLESADTLQHMKALIASVNLSPFEKEVFREYVRNQLTGLSPDYPAILKAVADVLPQGAKTPADHLKQIDNCLMRIRNKMTAIERRMRKLVKGSRAE